jgi:hypothetical protein
VTSVILFNRALKSNLKMRIEYFPAVNNTGWANFCV